MGWLVLGALLAQLVSIPPQGDWFGTMEGRDGRGLVLVPTKATITFTATTIHGEWISLPKHSSSGSLHGTIDAKGQITATLTLYSGAQINHDDAPPQVIALERCEGTATVKGALSITGVLRLTASKIELDNAIRRAERRECQNVTNVVWNMHIWH